MQILAFQQGLVIRRTGLAASVCINNDIFRAFTLPQRHLQRIALQLCRHPRRHQPADDGSRPQINYYRKVKPASVSAKIGDVSRSFLIRTTGVEVLLQRIFRHWQTMSTVTDRPEPARGLCAQPLTEQAGCDSFDVVRLKLISKTRRNIPLFGVIECLSNRLIADKTELLTRGYLMTTQTPGIPATAGYTEQPTQSFDVEISLMFSIKTYFISGASQSMSRPGQLFSLFYLLAIEPGIFGHKLLLTFGIRHRNCEACPERVLRPGL